MEDNKKEEQTEILSEEKTPVVENKKADNKNSAVLIFAVLGAMVFMLMVIAGIVFLPGL